MEPRSSEQAPTPTEYGPQPSNNEVAPAAQPERVPSTPEKGHEQVTQASAAVSDVVQLPTPIPIAPTANDSTQADDTSGPAVAADDDLIEKEWVDKAKEIIEKTKDDPYRREREVGRLQSDYLKKRYGKDLGNVA